MVIGTISIFFALFAFFVVNTKCMKIPLYNCRKYSTNHTFLCKTKPISKSRQCPQNLLQKQLTKIFATFCNQKTKPIQSQTKPISKMTKINATYFTQRDYEKILVFFRQKKQSQFKPNPEQSRGMNINSAITKCYENNPLLDAKKTKPIQTQSCPPEADFRKDKINLFSLWGGGLNFMHLRP